MNYNATFQEALNILNDEQRTAVETIEGPQMVIAGPGTGKTQVIAARIGNILAKTDTDPQNILCLTYTEAATVAMRKRLIQFIGPSAYKVNIFTFHAFCNQVIQDNLRYFGGYRSLQPITDLEKAELFERMIDALPNDHTLKRLTGDRYYEGRRLAGLFDLMKKENWSVKYMLDKLEQYKEDLKHDESMLYKTNRPSAGKKKGDLNERVYNQAIDKIEPLTAAIPLFDQYNRELKEMQRYDFHDMIVWVLNAFHNHPDLLLDYQERFQYILVDEYQDTNGAQNALLYKLCDYWDAPNIFVVGDDDQSIYRFQGANMENILNFKKTYAPHLKETVLKKNYRSTQQILDASRSLITRGQERLESQFPHLSKELTASGPDPVGLPPRVTPFLNVLHEKAHLVQRLSKWYEEGQNLDEVAVIYRSHKQAQEVIQALEKKGIPVQLKRKINVLEEYWIHRLLQICRYLSQEAEKPFSGEPLLAEIMQYSFFGIHPFDVARIARYCAYKPEEEESSKRWIDVLQDEKKLYALQLKTPEKVRSFVQNITKWQQSYFNETVQVQVDKIMTYSGMLAEMLKSPDKAWNMQLLTTFYDLIKEESVRHSFMPLSQLIETVDKMMKYGIQLPVQKNLVQENGVHFLTAHSSKGLEFDHVIILGANNNNWEGKRAYTGTYSIPSSVFESQATNAEEDERRLFYVAMTRARKYLDIYLSEENEKEKEIQESQFLVELREDGVLTEESSRALSDDEMISFSVDLILNKDQAQWEWIDRVMAADALKNFKLSVTALNKYLSCPISFYFDNLLKVPSARTVHTGFGNAIHMTLEQMHNLFGDRGQYPTVQEVLSIFEQKMNHLHSHFTQQEFDDRMAYGRMILPKYMEEYQSGWEQCTNFEMEYNVSGAVVEDVPIKGRLDRVEIYPDGVVVVDFKTGKVDRGRKKTKRPASEDDPGEDYWRQMVFYKLLMDHDPRKNWTWKTGYFDFIQPDSKTDKLSKIEVPVDGAAEEKVKNQIKETWKEIGSLNFEQGCGEEDCKWCQFVKFNKIVPGDLDDEANVEEMDVSAQVSDPGLD